MEKLRDLLQKNREIVLYIVFGVLTTAVNYVVYIATYYGLPFHGTTIPNVIAWVLSVLFAYVTNRIWVFCSCAHGFAPIFREMVSFFSARVLTLLMESAILWIFVDRLAFSNLLVKLAANVLVIVLNYVLSKFWIFKGKKQKNGAEGEFSAEK